MDNNMTELKPAERSRTYHFTNGTVWLQNVTHFGVGKTTHRLKTADGKLHIVPLGWLHIEIDADGWTL